MLSGKIANPEYWNINLIGCMTISLSQIMKIEKILIENKNYIIMIEKLLNICLCL